MIKKIRESFSVKVFLFTSVLLICSNGFLLAGMYQLLPQLYEGNIQNYLEECANKFKVELQDKSLKNVADVLNSACRTNNLLTGVYDENGLPVRNLELEEQFKISNFEKGSIMFLATEDTKSEQRQIWVDKDGKEEKNARVTEVKIAGTGNCFIVIYAIDLGRSELLLEDMKKILPIMLFLVIVFSFLISVIYTKFVTSPVLKAAKAAEHISATKWEDSEIMNHRKDEIGTLFRNIHSASVKLKKAAEERNDFFSAAAHELKTPVTILKGQLTGMIYRVGVYADREKYLRKAYDTTEEMEQRVLHILDIASIENTNDKVSREKINFSKILRDKIAIYEDSMNDKNIMLQIDFPDEIYLLGDKKLLEKAVENILQNAVKYSPEGESIKIDMFQKNMWILQILNTGVWLPEGKESDLFVPFYRLEESRSKDKGGAGLGLYIVKKALELQKFEYSIKNTIEGVVFEIKFCR